MRDDDGLGDVAARPAMVEPLGTSVRQLHLGMKEKTLCGGTVAVYVKRFKISLRYLTVRNKDIWKACHTT
ncbi:hypothetical protein PHLCEN_2v3181 [Hermanssonia centrifuga]|uniref:Uncharacterized protein n=1 Tax=Hermanssonia centrifuga TaxID=98765 RepID=A0A2R6R0X7_9APHY|nr:hypothetical protein PHLCEN_2v3181 [Hermanssonia centrifuga]